MNRIALKKLLKQVEAFNPNKLIEWNVLLNGKAVTVKMKLDEFKQVARVYMEALS